MQIQICISTTRILAIPNLHASVAVSAARLPVQSPLPCSHGACTRASTLAPLPSWSLHHHVTARELARYNPQPPHLHYPHPPGIAATPPLALQSQLPILLLRCTRITTPSTLVCSLLHPYVPRQFRPDTRHPFAMADSNPSTPDVEVDSDTVFDSPSPSPVPSSPTADASLPEDPSAERPAPRKASTATATTNMTSSSTPLGNINAARNPRPANPPTISSRGSGLNVSQDILARIQAVHLGRKGAPPTGLPGRGPAPQSPGPSLDNRNPLSPGGNPGGVPPNFRMPARPPTTNFQSAPAIPGRMPEPKKSMAERRGMQLPGGLPGTSPAAPPAGRKKPGLTLGMMNGGDKAQNDTQPHKQETQFDQFSQYIDTKTGSLKFAGKAILNSEGVQFASGTTFNISLDEVDTLDELGKGNYGTVYKVRHSRPRMRKPGQGLAGNKAAPGSPSRKNFDEESSPSSAKPAAGTGIVMAMKEMRLELEDSKFATIIMELDVLHRCRSPYIVDFYGAFFQEGAVYICMEFMDGGSIDKLYADGVPEGVLRKITLATTMGLKSLKDDHNIIHRDVKPTNILVNTRGAIKICDFGVSGNLVASIAKTNIGCQSYMAPERISSGGIAQAGANPGGGTYSVQSDIWSLGLTIIECALGQYPYPPETYNNIFSQLSVSTTKHLFFSGQPTNNFFLGYRRWRPTGPA